MMMEVSLWKSEHLQLLWNRYIFLFESNLTQLLSFVPCLRSFLSGHKQAREIVLTTRGQHTNVRIH